MQPDLFNVISTVASVFLVMSTGALARRWKILERDVDRSLAVLTKSILMPALFFHRIMTDSQLSMAFDAWIPSIYGFGCTAGGIAIAGWFAWSMGHRFAIRSESQRRTFAFCAGINNYGYIPFPLAEVFFPSSIVTLMIFNVGVDAALWSIGLFVISGKGIRESWTRVILSPPLLAVALAIALRQLHWDVWFPQTLLQACQQLGKCSIPMGLVLSGAIIYDFSGKLRWGGLWRPFSLAIIVRMVVLPSMILGLITLTDHRELRQVLIVQAAMPAATFPIVMTRLYDQDVETAWIVVVGTSAFAMVTIPLWLLFAPAYG